MITKLHIYSDWQPICTFLGGILLGVLLNSAYSKNKVIHNVPVLVIVLVLVPVEVLWSSGYVAGLSITRSAVRVPPPH